MIKWKYKSERQIKSIFELININIQKNNRVSNSRFFNYSGQCYKYKYLNYNMNKYEVLGVVGEGAYGVVLKCRNKENGEIRIYYFLSIY